MSDTVSVAFNKKLPGGNMPIILTLPSQTNIILNGDRKYDFEEFVKIAQGSDIIETEKARVEYLKKVENYFDDPIEFKSFTSSLDGLLSRGELGDKSPEELAKLLNEKTKQNYPTEFNKSIGKKILDGVFGDENLERIRLSIGGAVERVFQTKFIQEAISMLNRILIIAGSVTLIASGIALVTSVFLLFYHLANAEKEGSRGTSIKNAYELFKEISNLIAKTIQKNPENNHLILELIRFKTRLLEMIERICDVTTTGKIKNSVGQKKRMAGFQEVGSSGVTSPLGTVTILNANNVYKIRGTKYLLPPRIVTFKEDSTEKQLEGKTSRKTVVKEEKNLLLRVIRYIPFVGRVVGKRKEIINKANNGIREYENKFKRTIPDTKDRATLVIDTKKNIKELIEKSKDETTEVKMKLDSLNEGEITYKPNALNEEELSKKAKFLKEQMARKYGLDKNIEELKVSKEMEVKKREEIGPRESENSLKKIIQRIEFYNKQLKDCEAATKDLTKKVEVFRKKL